MYKRQVVAGAQLGAAGGFQGEFEPGQGERAADRERPVQQVRSALDQQFPGLGAVGELAGRDRAPLGLPFDDAGEGEVEQGRPGPGEVGGRAGGQSGLLVHGAVGQPAQAAFGDQGDGGVGDQCRAVRRHGSDHGPSLGLPRPGLEMFSLQE